MASSSVKLTNRRIAGCIILPCYLSWARLQFVFGAESMIRGRELKAAAS